ncbi:MAG: metallophosphoesterase [Pseudomonadales bacterium]|nr:metallophosphoesterase [Pseudomonadales bacterium]
MRIYTVSDLHVDYPENLQWVLNLSDDEHLEDTLIVAGDVSDDMSLLSKVFDALQKKFAAVHFVPGNHELWVDKGNYSCSLEKFDAVIDLCRERGVHVDSHENSHFSIIPLFSWYDFSFGEPDTYLRRAWRDFRACSWPSHLNDSNAVSKHFLDLNDLTAHEARINSFNGTVISYSHFLPRIDVMPSSIPSKKRKVYPVLGSDGLGQQVARLNPDIHIYGHSHVNQHKTIEGISYINNAFAYPSEHRIARKGLHCVWEQ